MSLTSLIAAAALLLAVIAYVQARRTARKLAILEEQYWHLKFEHGELQAKVDPPKPRAPKETFVPLLRQAPRATSSPDK